MKIQHQYKKILGKFQNLEEIALTMVYKCIKEINTIYELL